MNKFSVKWRDYKSKLMIFVIVLFALFGTAHAVVKIDQADAQFSARVDNELRLMRTGGRGLACQILIQRIDASSATTTIAPLTSDENTWHPNDPKGTRSHVVPSDTLMRGEERNKPTSATVYLNPNRIDPSLSLFKLGTFVQQLAFASDLNEGTFSSDFKIRERRSAFFRNAWRESLGLEFYQTSGNVMTRDYQDAKKLGLIVPENQSYFPILDPAAFHPMAPSPEASPIPSP